MFIKNMTIKKIKRTSLFIFIIICICILLYFTFILLYKTHTDINNLEENLNLDNENLNLLYNNENEIIIENSENKNSYIKWVEFKGTSNLMSKLAKLDIDSHINNENIKFNWIELMSYLSCKYGGELSKFNQNDLSSLVNELKSGKSITELTSNYKLYSYYYESLDSIFHEYIGNYTMQSEDTNGNKIYQTKYGIKVFSPIASGYSFNHYKDFGSSRSYGYKRVHLGNDLLGNIGTPVIAVESGYVEALGWNQYGGWRVRHT